jgi:DNA-binding NarL/FixJ family response regulator
LTPRRSQTSTVLIQDRSRLFRESLRLVLSEDGHLAVADTVATGGDLLAACTDSPVDAVVLESTGVPWDVPQLIGRLQAIDGAIRAVGTFPPALRRHSVDGVVCVPRNASGRSIAAAITGLDADLDGHDRAFGADSGDATQRLTQRELQVLALISSGLTTSQISERLRISAKTVESRRQAMFAKLGVQSQSHAVAVGMRSGLLGHHNGAVSAPDPE